MSYFLNFWLINCGSLAQSALRRSLFSHFGCVIFVFLLQNICNPQTYILFVFVWCVTAATTTTSQQQSENSFENTHTHTHRRTHGGTQKTVKRNARVQNVLSVGCFQLFLLFLFRFFFSRSCAPVASRSLSTLCSPHGSCPPPQPPPRSKRAEDGGEESARHWGKNCVISTFCWFSTGYTCASKLPEMLF